MSEQLRRQLQQRLTQLRQAGVDYLPRLDGPPPVSPMNENSGHHTSEPTEDLPATDDLEQRRIALNLLAQTVNECKRCPELASTRTQTVFGVGALNPDLCFVGEAPGADEDRQGEPFVGAAGQLLNRIISAIGMTREEVYICNILRCRPPGNRQPKSEEATHCREFLDKQLELVRPKFICALGLTAAQNLLGKRSTLGSMRGNFYDYKGIPVIVTYHPASLLPSRSPENKKLVWEDMKMLLTRMGRPIPTSGGNRSSS